MGRDLKEIGDNVMEVPSCHLRGESSTSTKVLVKTAGDHT